MACPPNPVRRILVPTDLPVPNEEPSTQRRGAADKTTDMQDCFALDWIFPSVDAKGGNAGTGAHLPRMSGDEGKDAGKDTVIDTGGTDTDRAAGSTKCRDTDTGTDAPSAAAAAACPPITGLVVLLAGVGGDTSSPYIQDMAATAAARGWASVVCVPRGLADSPNVSSLDAVFDPSDLGDLHRAVCLACEAAAAGGKGGSSTEDIPVWIIGFSMGACMLCRYMGEFAARIPTCVRGGVAVSGAMELDFMQWGRYEEIYQPIIVPSLLTKVVGRYGDRLGQPGSAGEAAGVAGVAAVSPLEKLMGTRTYSDLFANVYSQRPRWQPPASSDGNSGIGDSTGGSTNGDVGEGMEYGFKAWKASMEGGSMRHLIDRPLLILAALDDPLHNPDLIGLEDMPSNPNVVHWLTGSGGHVGWPVAAAPASASGSASRSGSGSGSGSGSASGSSSGILGGLMPSYDFIWMTTVAADFCKAAAVDSGGSV